MKILGIFIVATVFGKKKGKTTDLKMEMANGTDFLLERLESERGQHKCSSIPIPKIKCTGCARGYPKYVRDCAKPNPNLRAKYKCKAVCGPGFRIKNGHPRRMKCLG